MHHSNDPTEMFRELKLQFSDGITTEVTVKNETNARITFNSQYLVSSSFVNITALESNHTHFHGNGFSDIKVFGYYEGI